MTTPKRFHNITLKDGTNYKFRLTIRSLRKLEESNNTTYQEMLSQMGNPESDPIKTFCEFTWAAQLPFNPAITKEDQLDLYDALIDEGYDTLDINSLLLHILQVSGLYPKDKDIEAELAAAQEEPGENPLT